jgi:hypothetical protein
LWIREVVLLSSTSAALFASLSGMLKVAGAAGAGAVVGVGGVMARAGTGTGTGYG